MEPVADTIQSTETVAPSSVTIERAPVPPAPVSLIPGEPEHLIARLQRVYPHTDLDVVRKAFFLAQDAHGDQCRSSGEPYIAHPVAVAHILTNLNLDPPSIVAGLLHDVVEDTLVRVDDIRARFGADIGAIVDGLTKFKAIEGRSKEDVQASSYRKMFIAMADDPRVMLIKLADRLHNMRTLQFTPVEKQQRIAKETLEIYAPLAHRLGIWQIKWELEDLAFRYLYPETYRAISRQLQLRRDVREKLVQRVIARLRHELNQQNIKADITGRPKHIYSIWRKMERKGVTLDQIYDQLAVRVIVDSKEDCYRVLGIVHATWTPIPNEIDDYIARPKESMYQSLHTTIIIPGEQPCEIQIRTQDMHDVAEHGIAAHWRYKEGSSRASEASVEAKLTWLRNLIAWRREIEEDQAFVESFKNDVLQEQVYVFTPKGKIIDLPQGSTPVDFAFRIHSDIGMNCVGARVNNRQVPLHHQLQNGDMIEVTTKTGRGPSRDWLEFVKTSGARTHIKRYFRRQERDANIAAGRHMLEREIKRLGMVIAFDEVAETSGYKQVDDLFLAIGVGDHHPREIVRKVIAKHKAAQDTTDPLAHLPETSPSRQSGMAKLDLQVQGASGIHTRLARCCSPVEGDPVIGYVTQGNGIAVHRADCRNVQGEHDRDRQIDVVWGTAKQDYPVPVRIEAWDRVGLWRDVTVAVADAGINITTVQQIPNKNAGRATLIATLMVDSLAQLTMILDKLNRVSNVIEARRERTLSA
jgi:GTP pyrophosphokinase